MNTDRHPNKIPDKSGLNPNRQTDVYIACDAAVHDMNALLGVYKQLPPNSKELLMYLSGIEITESDEHSAFNCLKQLRGHQSLEQFIFALVRVQLHTAKHKAAQDAHSRKSAAIVEDAATSKRDLKSEKPKLVKSQRGKFRVVESGGDPYDGLLPPSLLDVFEQ